MKVIMPGYRYELANFENQKAMPQVLQFIHKEPVPLPPEGGDPGTSHALRTVQDGTTNEEVLRVLINRLTFLHDKVPSPETRAAYNRLKDALDSLEERTKDRQDRKVEGTNAP